MKTIAATRAKNVLGQVLDDACVDLIMLERHGKEKVALMPAAEARMGVLCSYAAGAMPRATAMKRLGLTWYGELCDAMLAAGLQVQASAAKEQFMAAEVERLIGGQA
jgi:hypothetical protein